MSREVSFALEAAKEITVAHVSHANLTLCKETGEQVAEYYEAVFNNVLDLAKRED